MPQVLDIQGLQVDFPFDLVYPEQLEMMLEMKRALDAKGHAILESPTGTGKTVALLSLITAYQFAHPGSGKLVYCTRTIPEMNKCIEELKLVLKTRRDRLGMATDKVLAVCLSSRKNMCINQAALAAGDREGGVDAACRQRTSPYVRKTHPRVKGGNVHPALCKFFEEFEDHGARNFPPGVYSLDDVQALGETQGTCPYFLTRHLIDTANIIVYNFQYLLDPKVAAQVSKDLARDSCVVFDESHNVDSVAIEALSVTLNRRALEGASSNLATLRAQIGRVKQTDQDRLTREYQTLLSGLQNSGALPSSGLANPVLPQDVLNEVIPPSIQKAESFVTMMKQVVEHLAKRMDVDDVQIETPTRFLDTLEATLRMERKILQFSHARLDSLLRTLEVVDLDTYSPLTMVADFLTLVATPAYKSGFSVVIEPFDTRTVHFKNPVLQLACLDASFAIKPVFDRFDTVIITSGTLSPIDLYPKLLRFSPVVSKELRMTMNRPCILPLIVTRGSDQAPVSSQFSSRGDASVVRNYGELLIEVCATVPDGVVCFFTAYEAMERTVLAWNDAGVFTRVLEHKLVFIETKDIVETSLALDNFRRACDCGRGAVFLSVARGKVSEGVDFEKQYGRAVVLFGVPYQYTKSKVLLERLDYLKRTFGLSESDFLTFDAMRSAAQCLGRVLRSKQDWGIMILADLRYNQPAKRDKLPSWIKHELSDAHLNLSTDDAVAAMRLFLKSIAQPLATPAGDKLSSQGASKMLITEGHV